MARRRLSPLPSGPDAVPQRERPAASAPIATVAAEAAAASGAEEMAAAWLRAREEGRMLLDLPLAAVGTDHLVRDRLVPAGAPAPDPAEDEEMAALKASIRAHGQRAPVEVTPLDGPSAQGSAPYGLISGWRRIAALRTLHAETGEARFATVRAVVTRPQDAGAAYVAMVEENELRVGLSQYERARIAALAARRGVFASENAALHALYAGASRAKLSRIRAFLELYHALDAHLRFPQALPERLGLKLVERLRAGDAPGIAAALATAAPATPEAELALLDRLAAPPRPERRPERGGEGEELMPGVRLAVRRRGTTLSLTLKGRGVTAELESQVRQAVAGLR